MRRRLARTAPSGVVKGVVSEAENIILAAMAEAQGLG